ncbi:MAG: NAD-dependent epimerase/dehydratase family protein [Nevskiaceae bacterium]
MGRVAVIAGATGLVGSALLRRLLDDARYAEVRVLGRRRPAAVAGKVRFIETDFTDLAAHAATLAVDDVFCCLGTTIRAAGSQAAFERVDYHMVVDLARAAHQAGAKHFLVVSAVGASGHAAAFYSRVKGRMERAVRELPFAAVHIVRPSLLLGERAESRLGERAAQLISPLLSPLLRGPLAKYRAVPAEDVAAALVVLAKSDATGAHMHHLPLK